MFRERLRRGWERISRRLQRRPSLREKGLCFRQLAIMITSGVSVTRSLQVLAHPGTHPLLREAWLAVLQSVMSGRHLWEAMARYTQVFSLLEVSMVRAAERASCLGSCLNYLATSLESEVRMQRRLSAALQYPVLLGVVALAGMVAFLLWLLPAFIQGLDLGGELPWPTRLLLSASQFLHQGFRTGGLLLGIALALGAGARYLHTPWGRYQWQCATLRLAGLGQLFKMILVARFCELFATALRSGMALPASLEFASEAMVNYPLASAVRRVIDGLEAGYSLGQAFSNSRFFPRSVGQTLTMCEEVGDPVTNMERLGRALMLQADLQISQWSQLLEPAMLLVIAAFMAGSLVAMFLPLYQCFGSF